MARIIITLTNLSIHISPLKFQVPREEIKNLFFPLGRKWKLITTTTKKWIYEVLLNVLKNIILGV